MKTTFLEGNSDVYAPFRFGLGCHVNLQVAVSKESNITGPAQVKAQMFCCRSFVAVLVLVFSFSVDSRAVRAVLLPK